MPWIAPSHTAPVLPLKLWKPRLFSGLALCIGAAAPDLEFILRLDYNWIVSHTVAAQVFYTVPMVMLLHALLTWLVIPWLVPLLPGGRPFHLQDLSVLRPASTWRDWVRIGFSGYIGGLSHVFIDGFTHGNRTGWATKLLPSLRTPVGSGLWSLPLHDFLQVTLTIGLGLWGLQQLAEMGRRRSLLEWTGSPPPSVREATPLERRRALQYVLFCAALGAAAGLARRDDTLGPWIEITAHGILAFVFYGVVLAAAADRVRARRAAAIAADAS